MLTKINSKINTKQIVIVSKITISQNAKGSVLTKLGKKLATNLKNISQKVKNY